MACRAAVTHSGRAVERSEEIELNCGGSRSGLFWDGVEGRAPAPPAAVTLGFEFVSVDPELQSIDLAFNASEDWMNPSGNVLGAFVAAMLYDTVGPALLATLEPEEFQSTVELGVHFLRAVRPGRVTTRGRVVHRDGDRAMIEATLWDTDGEMAARATATAQVIPWDRASVAP